LQPEQLRQQTFVSLRRLFKSLANQGPLVIALDDLHWIDPISAEMLQFLLTIVASAPILFVCAQRRQGGDAPNDRLVRIQSLIPMQTVRLCLERLSAEESEVLLTELLSGSELPLMLRTSILEQSEGNPYFIEEFVRMLIEQGHLQYRDDRWTIAPNLPPDQVPVPSSLETLIRARLDALPPELKDLLQCAAIIGAPFEGDLLHAVSGQPDVEAALRRLESRLLVHRGHEVDQWLFSHSLVEGVAYDGMLRTRREALHLKTAQVLETRWAGAEAEHAKVLAYHYVRADQGGKALTYLMTAGEQAAAQSAYEEAISYFEQAAERLSERPDAPDSIRWRLAAGMGDVYRSMGQYADSMVALKAGLALVQVGQLPTGFRAGLYRRLGETAQKQGDLNLAYEYYHNALSALDELSDDWLRTEAARSMAGLAWVHFLQGRFEQALQACHLGLDHARKADALNELAAAENLLGGIYWRQSEWALALQHARRAMVLREQMGYTWGVASTLANLGILAFLAGEWNKAMSYFERSLALRQEMGDVEGMTIVHNNMGLVTRDQGHLDEAEEHFRESLSLATRFEIGYHIANSGIGLAQVLLKKGEIDAARKAIDAALERIDVVGAGDLRAEAYHILAQILMAESKWDEAVVVAKRSAGMAAESGNRSLEASAWRVVSEIELDRHDARAAREALAQAQEVLADVTDELEIGRVSAQAGRIDLHEGHIAQAQEHLHAAQRIFVRLGAALDLRHVEEALRVR
jgi:predicted ATPase